jgi:hypothetical protein
MYTTFFYRERSARPGENGRERGRPWGLRRWRRRARRGGRSREARPGASALPMPPRTLVGPPGRRTARAGWAPRRRRPSPWEAGGASAGKVETGSGTGVRVESRSECRRAVRVLRFGSGWPRWTWVRFRCCVESGSRSTGLMEILAHLGPDKLSSSTMIHIKVTTSPTHLWRVA